METLVQTPTGKRNPEFKYLIFQLNTETKYYELIRGEIGFTKVPGELHLEVTQRPEQIRSGIILQSRQINGKRPFFTGLLKTPFENWYFGDFYEKKNGIKRNSFILFHFSPDNSRFEMFFFNLFKLYPKDRDRFIFDFIPRLKK
jgi:hypothetical protein